MNINKEKYLCYRRGAKDGFTGRCQDKSNSEHKSEIIRNAYLAGHKKGWELARLVAQCAETYSGHKPDVVDIVSR